MSATRPRLEFWYDFASTYSYLSAMRIEALAAAAGVDVAWKPFLLGPIFQAQGWTTSPFNLYPAKGRNMVRDIERLAAERGLAFALPARISTEQPHGRAAGAGRRRRGLDRTLHARRLRGRVRARRRHLRPRRRSAPSCKAYTLIPRGFSSRIEQPDIKDASQAADGGGAARGIFGAPSFLVGDELFWGDDRLEQALAWAGAAEQAFIAHSCDSRQDRGHGINNGDDYRAQDTAQDTGNFGCRCSPGTVRLRSASPGA